MTRPPLDEYLDLITGRGGGSGYIELRCRHEGGMRTRFYRARQDRRTLARRAVELGFSRDVYIGCALRQRQRGTRDHIGEAWTLWVECDTLHASTAARAFQPSPSLLVASGTPGHIHAYWALDAPIDADTLEDANRRLAAAIGGDSVCYDAARILRPPGTFNHKYVPPPAVRQIAVSQRGPLQLGEVIDRVPSLIIPATPSPAGDRRDSDGDPLLAIPPETYVAELTGESIGRDRKASCPFHQDRTPSLHAYPTPEEGWFCFGCRRGGTVYDLAAELWRLDTRGHDFNLLRDRLRNHFLT